MAFLFIMENEIWEDIPNYEGSYQISNLGRVKSLPRKKCNHKFCYITKEIILKNAIGTHGYYYVRLSNNNIPKNYTIHKLVAICFLNHVPNGYNMVVNHKDFNKLNNHVDNLEIVTHRENTNMKHIKSSSQYVGVNFHKQSKKFESRIFLNGKRIHLGVFNNEYDAHIAYQNKLKEIEAI